jgi:hypothetical protein
MLHPESTAYDLFDGKRYPPAPLPESLSRDAVASMGEVDPRLGREVNVLGVRVGDATRAYPLDALAERACIVDTIEDVPVALFWYGPTRTAVAFARDVDGETLEFYADEVSPETAPFKDRETGTRWTLAGRAVDGPHRGKELRWIDSIQCRWYAWVAEHPETTLHENPTASGR